MNLLIVEDDPIQLNTLAKILQKQGYKVYKALDKRTSLELVSSIELDVAILDLRLKDTDGLTLLKELRKINPGLKFIMITAFGTIETAVEAIKLGAVDFLPKPINLKTLLMLLEKIKEELESEELQEDFIRPENIIYASKLMAEVIRKAYQMARSNYPVLITGESGTGKEEIAKFIHQVSNREGKFIAISCATIPSELLETELFGYERGAFTGAERSKKGFIELARGGTLFLDEIGEMPLNLQAKLLRFLETGKYWKVGGIREEEADVRIITATNRDLLKMVKEGKFREDLFYRINVLHLHIPPLRDRKEDIIPLAKHFLKLCKEAHPEVKAKDFSQEALYFLLSYEFPGNVRELKHMVERACLLSGKEKIHVQDLMDKPYPLKRVLFKLEEVEKEHIKKVLLITGGNISEAAELLGIHRNTLSQKIKRYGIDLKDLNNRNKNFKL